jgi:hypothetical protein
MALKVVAPYITIKVRDDNGGTVIREFYQGGVIPDEADPDNVARLVEGGMLADEDSPEAEVLGNPAGTPVPGEPPNVPVTEAAQGPALAPDERMARALAAADKAGTADAGGRPKDYASKPEWVDWAVSQRPEDVSEEDARAQAEAKSKADLIAQYGG